MQNSASRLNSGGDEVPDPRDPRLKMKLGRLNPAYPLLRSPAAMPLIVRWIPVTTSSSVSPAR
jgi:hypothetical protein